MSRITLLLYKAIVVEFVIILLTFLVAGMFFAGIENIFEGIFTILQMVFLPLFIALVPCFLIATVIGQYLKLAKLNNFTYITGIVITFLFLFTAITIGLVSYYFITEGKLIPIYNFKGASSFLFYLCGLQTLGVGFWLGDKLFALKQSSKN